MVAQLTVTACGYRAEDIELKTQRTWLVRILVLAKGLDLPMKLPVPKRYARPFTVKGIAKKKRGHSGTDKEPAQKKVKG